jgi:hypothetical protein
MNYSLTFSCTEPIVYLGRSESSDRWRDDQSYRQGLELSQGRCSVIWLFVRDQPRTYVYGHAAVGGVHRLFHPSYRGQMGQGRVSRRQDAYYGRYRLGMSYAIYSINEISADKQGNVSYHMPSLHALFYLPEAKAGDFPRKSIILKDVFAHYQIPRPLPSGPTPSRQHLPPLKRQRRSLQLASE